MIPLPVVSPTVIGTVMVEPAAPLMFGSETVTGGVPVAVAVGVPVAVFVFVGVAVFVRVKVAVGDGDIGVVMAVGVNVGVFVAVKVGVGLPPATVTLPLIGEATGSPSLKFIPGCMMLPGSV